MAALALPSAEELRRIYDIKYCRKGEPGWSPRLRLRFRYFTPDDHYEAVVAASVKEGCTWADVGCGRDIFPHNPDLAVQLAKRCSFVLGIDPDRNILDNPFLTESFMGMVEDYPGGRQFDLVTLRMVAEHIQDPEKSVSRIARLVRPGGRLVIYTPYEWAVMSVCAAISPFALHHPIKRLLWGGEKRDTFPTAYKLNTRKTLAHYCGRNDLKEVLFAHLDDCRTFGRFYPLAYGELVLQRALSALGIRYPESCILAVYEKT
ncbi:MAG: class I SAM-dependent methyltransferase [Betaproteobacteria bacterium]